MVEFLICSLVLLALLVAMPALRDLQRQQLQLIQTARRAAVLGEWRHWRSSPVPGAAAALQAAVLTPLRIAATLSASALPFANEGLQSRERHRDVVLPADLPPPLAGLQLHLSEHQVMLGDAWSASGTADTERRVRPLSIATLTGSLSRVLRPALVLAAPVEPALGRLCLGALGVESLPADRLGAPVDGGARLSGAPPC